MKFSIKPINFDLINDRVELLVGGLKSLWISGDYYRALLSLADNFTSGLRHVRTTISYYQTTLYYNDDNVIRHIDYNGSAQSNFIKRIIYGN